MMSNKNYTLKITYKDGHLIDIKLSEEDAEVFFECINSSKIYWSKDTGQGFWTNLLDIRYLHILPIEESSGFPGESQVPFEAST
jgi:hypothetical protein